MKTTLAHVYHYTAGAYLQPILESGGLVPSNAGADDEAPAVWFSARSTYEPTAVKMLRGPNGTVRQMSFSEQVSKLGAVRFGLQISDPRLLPWQQACRALGMPREVRRSLEAVGRRQGANPDHWYAVLAPVGLEDLSGEVWQEGRWADLKLQRYRVGGDESVNAAGKLQ